MAVETNSKPEKRSTETKKPGQHRRGTKNPLIYAGTVVLLVLVVVAFVFLPASGGAFGENQGAIEFGSYAGRPISMIPGSYFMRQVNAIKNSIDPQQLSNEATARYFMYQIWRGAFDETALHFGILDAMKKAGARVSEERIDQTIKTLPSFQENGVFVLQRFNSLPMNQKLSLRQDIREDLLTRRYYEDVTQNRKPSSKEIEFIQAMNKDTRAVNYVAFSIDSYPESEAASWALAHPEPVKRLWLSRITIDSSEDEALKLRKEVEAGTLVFADAAKAKSKDQYASKGGDMGYSFAYELASELAKKEDAQAVTALKKGELSPVYKTSAGTWAFFKAEGDASSPNLADPAILKSVKDYMLRNERGSVEDWALAQAKAFSAKAGSVGFKAAGTSLGKTIKKTGAFPINYGNLSIYLSQYRQSLPMFEAVGGPDHPELVGASTSERFLQTAFSLEPGSVSEPILLGDHVIVFESIRQSAEADDSQLDSIPGFYPYFVMSSLQAESRQAMLKSPALKNNFDTVYTKSLAPQN